ncbi:HYR domain-containing protein, partial [Arthrospira platensis SPKY1]|nr:HYR domain-containing protein [Arthrospira platensis SPKY1]
SGETFNLGESTVEYTITEQASGQTLSCSFTVTVYDDESPVLACPNNITRNTNPNVCTYTFSGAAANASIVGDNCSAAGDMTLVNDFNGTSTLVGAAIPHGVNVITWTLTDEAGNFSSCSFT